MSKLRFSTSALEETRLRRAYSIMRSFCCLAVILCLFSSCRENPSGVREIRVATASNFLPVLNEIADKFTKSNGVKVSITSASTGVIFSQVENGAPFDLFLSADQRRPSLLIKRGLAKGRTSFTYAKGRLALVCSEKRELPASISILMANAPFSLAIANEKLAPFGRAALQALGQSRQSLASLGIQVVRGTNASQTWQFMLSGAVDYGIVPLSMAMTAELAYKELPRSTYDTIQQVAVMLKSTKAEADCCEFLDFLKGDVAQRIIVNAGYDVGEN